MTKGQRIFFFLLCSNINFISLQGCRNGFIDLYQKSSVNLTTILVCLQIILQSSSQNIFAVHESVLSNVKILENALLKNFMMYNLRTIPLFKQTMEIKYLRKLVEGCQMCRGISNLICFKYLLEIYKHPIHDTLVLCISLYIRNLYYVAKNTEKPFQIWPHCTVVLRTRFSRH